MDVRFYNTLTRRVEPFEPLEPGKVRIYSCGPTVYDFAHIGNFRSFLFADLVRRLLETVGHDVHHVMNITDVGHMVDDTVADGGGEDRMVVASRRIKEDKKRGTVDAGDVENPDDPFQIADFYMHRFLEDGRRLGLAVASEFPENVLRATETIPQMIGTIERLLERGHAYRAGDVIYYSVESFPDYGALSGNTLDNLRAGAGGRVSDAEQATKRHPADFLLWKVDPSHVMKWDSPWGAGYPGWHVECSTMAMERLGPVIDIHTGGEDLIFPHHECEIAQSCGVTGESTFARFWMHARFLLVEGEKMSKSRGNFYTVRDVLEGRATDGRPVHPAVLRYELIKAHYRQNMNFTTKGLQDSAGAVRKLGRFVEALEAETGGAVAEVDDTHPILARALGALCDDLNVSEALGVLLPFASTTPDDPREALAVCRRLNRVLQVMPLDAAETGPTEAGGDALDAEAVCRAIDEARAAKDYGTADALRQQLIDAGWEVSTGPDGTKPTRPLA